MNTDTAPAYQDLSVDREAVFARFMESHRERAIRTAYRLVGGDLNAAEDVAQESFARAYESLGKFRDDASISTWFYRILVRQASNYRRWRGVRQRWAGLWKEEFPDPRQAPPGDPILRERIFSALDTLSPNQRTVFVLVHLDGFTVADAAHISGCALGTAKSHLHRALQRMRQQLEDIQESP